MALAVEEGRKGWGRVSPNPLVGCVILSPAGQLLSAGAHLRYGEAHAEANALKPFLSRPAQSDPEALRGARIFVTLEPCAHQGKTPSCARALAQLPVAEVIYGALDPNPLVQGKGLAILNEAGIKTRIACDESRWECEDLAEHFLINFREKRPFVSLKIAASLDSQMASANGESQWITSSEARDFGHFLRAGHDGILVGARTLMADNSMLNIRIPGFDDLTTKKIFVLDPGGRSLSLLSSSGSKLKLLSAHAPQNLHFLVGSSVPSSGSSVPGSSPGSSANFPKDINIHAMGNPYDLSLVLDYVWQNSVRSLLVESGPSLTSSFIDKLLYDRVYLLQAPILLGGGSGRSYSQQVSMKGIAEKQNLGPLRVKQLGPDVLITARRMNSNYGRRPQT